MTEWWRVPLPMGLCAVLGYLLHQNIIDNNTFWIITDIVVIVMYITFNTVLQYRKQKKCNIN